MNSYSWLMKEHWRNAFLLLLTMGLWALNLFALPLVSAAMADVCGDGFFGFIILLVFLVWPTLVTNAVSAALPPAWGGQLAKRTRNQIHRQAPWQHRVRCARHDHESGI